MDGANLAALVEVGQLMFSAKLVFTAINWMWVYDYFLTLRDEIKYAWSGRKSWIFVLFLAVMASQVPKLVMYLMVQQNRYTPALYITWYYLAQHGYIDCEKTKWSSIIYTTAIMAFAQITFALRIYSVTGRNKILGGSLSALIFAQFCFGVYLTIRFGIAPAQQLPNINLHMFHACMYKRWRAGELVFTNIAMAFDLLAFLAILVTARRRRIFRYPGIPHLLGAMLRDATQYFLFVFFFQALFEVFLLFTPDKIQLVPGAVNTILVPTMASRLMLSLKKAAAEPAVPWSLATMSEPVGGTERERGTTHFTAQTLDGSHGTSAASTLSDTGDIELESVTPRLPRNRRPQEPC